MALGITLLQPEIKNVGLVIRKLRLTGDTDYPADGYPLGDSLLGVNRLLFLVVENPSSAGHFWQYLPSTKKILVRAVTTDGNAQTDLALNAQVAVGLNAVDASTVDVLVIGN